MGSENGQHETPPHPAKWSESVLEKIAELGVEGDTLDPFAGVGIARLAEALGPSCRCVGLEIEPDWARADPRSVVGDALHPPFRPRSFRYGVTSCTYGNRMADHHNAQERCRPCAGTGTVNPSTGPTSELGAVRITCPKCNGAGRRSYKRLTYKHQIGHDLHPNNSGAMHWGPGYCEFHESAWAANLPLFTDGFVLNVKDHWKTVGPKGARVEERQEVTTWHIRTILNLGWRLARWELVEVPGMRMGANRDAREGFESVLLFIPG